MFESNMPDRFIFSTSVLMVVASEFKATAIEMKKVGIYFVD